MIPEYEVVTENEDNLVETENETDSDSGSDDDIDLACYEDVTDEE